MVKPGASTASKKAAKQARQAAVASKHKLATGPKDDDNDDDDDDVPAPPTRFRCNRARMLLTIRVTLHHIAAAQINLRTTKTRIEPCWANQKPRGKPVPGRVQASRALRNRTPAPRETANQTTSSVSTSRRLARQYAAGSAEGWGVFMRPGAYRSGPWRARRVPGWRGAAVERLRRRDAVYEACRFELGFVASP